VCCDPRQFQARGTFWRGKGINVNGKHRVGADFSRRWIVAAHPGSIAFQPSGLQHAVPFNFDILDEGGLPCQPPGFGSGSICCRGGFTPPFGEVNSPLHHQTDPLPGFCEMRRFYPTMFQL
jgi:hypothetical protein